MGEHHEGEATIGDQSLGPHVIRAMKTRSDLVEVVSGTNAPFPVVSVHHVGNVVELRWISFSFGLQSSLKVSLLHTGFIKYQRRRDLENLRARHHQVRGRELV